MFDMIATKQNNTTIGIDGGDYNLQGAPCGGIARLVGSFMNVINHHITNKQWIYYYFGNKNTSWKSESIILRRLSSRLFSSLFLPLNFLFDEVKVFLGFSGVLPPFTLFLKKKSIVFIHDFAFYAYPNLYHDASVMKWQSEYAIYGATKVVVFTDYIKQQILKRFPRINKDKIIRIYPGMNHLSRVSVKKISDSYFLYVGVIKPMKNIEKLLIYFKDFLTVSQNKQIKLILIGPHEQPYIKQLLQTKLYLEIKENVLFLQSVSDQELTSYYVCAMAILNTSYEEGFCYPVVEALYLGKTVIVNDLSIYKEFTPYFKRLRITTSGEDFVRQMVLLAKQPINNTLVKQELFTLEHFTKEVLRLINTI